MQQQRRACQEFVLHWLLLHVSESTYSDPNEADEYLLQFQGNLMWNKQHAPGTVDLGPPSLRAVPGIG